MAVAVSAKALPLLKAVSGNFVLGGNEGLVDISDGVPQQSLYGSMGFRMTPRHMPRPAHSASQFAYAPLHWHPISMQRPCLVSVLGEKVLANHKTVRKKPLQRNWLQLGLQGLVAWAIALAPRPPCFFRSAWHNRTASIADEACEKGGTVSMEELEARRHSSRLFVSGLCLALYVIFGLLYGQMRGWSVTDACYFVIVTLTTVGYGDQTFRADMNDQLFGGFYILVGVAFIGTAAGEFISEVTARADRTAANLRGNPQTENNTLLQPSLGGSLRYGVEGRRYESQAELRKLRRLLLRTLAKLVAIVFGGTCVMAFVEGWSWPTAFLWACVTCTTVGYGDSVPTTTLSKWIVMFYMTLSLVFVANALALIARLPTEQRKIRDTEKIMQQFGDSLEAEELGALLDSNEIRALRPRRQVAEDQSRSSVNRAEFIIWLLIKKGKLDLKKDIGPCAHVFDSLDPDNSGVLDQHDIDHFDRMKRRQAASLSRQLSSAARWSQTAGL